MSYTSLTVCLHQRLSNKSCGAGGGEAIAKALAEALHARNSKLTVNRIFCFGMCEHGPNVRLTPGGPFFHHVTKDNLGEILEAVEAIEQTPPPP